MGKVYQSLAGAVMGGVELTRAAVSGGFSSVMSSRMGQMVSSGMGLALSRSEDWVDHNLPLTERELGESVRLPRETGSGDLPPAAG